MCGICGSTSDPHAAMVTAMNNAMVHRGPDDEGTYVDPQMSMALGARRLSIIDPTGGHQPLSNEDGTVWAVLNGEIYNHPALRQQLLSRGHTLATGTDTEVLVHLYEDFGDQLVHALEGMYAFAIWDARERRLLIGRDRFGEKPLFYFEEPSGGLVFASELSALMASGAVPAQLDEAAIDRFFVFGYVPGPRTMMRDVRLLPAGHMLEWRPSRTGIELSSYWTPPEHVTTTTESVPELIDEARYLLEAAVRSRMISDVPLGVFLSGGIDSTLIAALAAQTAAHPVETFTVGYEVGQENETGAAAQTARELGTEHHEIVLTNREVAATVPALLTSIDQPIADEALVALHAVAGFARERITVAVGGEGADELFGGYPRYQWLTRAERLDATLPRSLARVGARMAASLPAGARARRLADVLRPATTVERHLGWVTSHRRELRERLYGPALGEALHDDALIDELADIVQADANGNVAARHMVLDQKHWLVDDVLAKADRAGMLASLEIRTPYLHRELVEFASTVPPHLHLRDGGKALLRSVLGEVLPATRQKRRKRAFEVPIAEWLRGPLAPALNEQIETGSLFEQGWFDRDSTRALSREHLDGEHDWSKALWPILCLGLWLDTLNKSAPLG